MGRSCGQLYKEGPGKLPPGRIFFSLKFPHGIAPVSHGKDKKIFFVCGQGLEKNISSPPGFFLGLFPPYTILLFAGSGKRKSHHT
jgi:hypothetical protein